MFNSYDIVIAPLLILELDEFFLRNTYQPLDGSKATVLLVADGPKFTVQAFFWFVLTKD